MRKNPTILGKKMKSLPGDEWRWRSGRVEVFISPSTSGDKPDFAIGILVFGEGVISDWRNTLDESVVFAERKLLQLRRALGGVQ